MNTIRTTIALAAIAAFAIAYVTAPAASAATPSCGTVVSKIMDPGLRASFVAFEAQQSGSRHQGVRGFPQRWLRLSPPLRSR